MIEIIRNLLWTGDIASSIFILALVLTIGVLLSKIRIGGFSSRYTPRARRTESYYDRHAATYGRALGQGNVSRWSNGGNGANYTRSNNSRYVNNGRRPTIGTTRANTYNNRGYNSTNRTTNRWNNGSNNNRSYNTTRSTYSTPSRSYSPSRSTTTTTTTTTRNNGTGGGRR